MYITVTYILSIFRKSNESNEYTCSNSLSKPHTCWITSFQKLNDIQRKSWVRNHSQKEACWILLCGTSSIK